MSNEDFRENVIYELVKLGCASKEDVIALFDLKFTDEDRTAGAEAVAQRLTDDLWEGSVTCEDQTR